MVSNAFFEIEKKTEFSRIFLKPQLFNYFERSLNSAALNETRIVSSKKTQPFEEFIYPVVYPVERSQILLEKLKETSV